MVAVGDSVFMVALGPALLEAKVIEDGLDAGDYYGTPGEAAFKVEVTSPNNYFHHLGHHLIVAESDIL